MWLQICHAIRRLSCRWGQATTSTCSPTNWDIRPASGLLPPFPFGWRGSGLEVPEAVFVPYIVNLLDSLRDDGFTRVYCLAPQGFDPQSAQLQR